jgi:hypothetical protein
MLLTFVTYVSRAFRWQVLLNPLKPVRIGPLFTTNLLGFTGIFVLGRAGEVIRPLWLTRREQIPLTASVATIIVERFVDTLMLVCLFGWALIAVEVPSKASGPRFDEECGMGYGCRIYCPQSYFCLSLDPTSIGLFSTSRSNRWVQF